MSASQTVIIKSILSKLDTEQFPSFVFFGDGLKKKPTKVCFFKYVSKYSLLHAISNFNQRVRIYLNSASKINSHLSKFKLTLVGRQNRQHHPHKKLGDIFLHSVSVV